MVEEVKEEESKAVATKPVYQKKQIGKKQEEPKREVTQIAPAPVLFKADAPVFTPSAEAKKAQEDFLANFPDDFEDLAPPVQTPAPQQDMSNLMALL